MAAVRWWRHIVVVFYIYFKFFPLFCPKLVANYILSIPITHVAVDTPQQPRRLAAREGKDIRERCAFSKPHHLKFYPRDHDSETGVSRALLYTAIQQPLLSPPPSLGVASQLCHSI